MPFHYDDDKKKKKKRIIETDPAKKAWKALQSGGLDPMPFDDGFDVYEAKKHLKEEVKGMGPEGKRFLKDKLSGKKYEGKLKPKFKKDLLKELEGMSSKGKSFVKKELGDPRQSYEDYLDRKIGDLADRKRKGAFGVEKPDNKKKDKPMEFKGPDFLKPKGWDDMSEKNKASRAKMMVGAMSDIGQSIGKGMSDKDMKSYVKKEKGDSKKHKIDHHSLKGLSQKDIENLPEDSPLKDEFRNIAENFLDEEEKKNPALGTIARTLKQKRRSGGWSRRVPDVGEDEKSVFGITKEQRKALNKKFGHDQKEYRPDLLREKEKARKRFVKTNKEFEAHRKEMKEGKYEKKKPLYYKEDIDAIKAEREKVKKLADEYSKEKGDSKNWIQDAVKKPGALRDTAKRMSLIKGDELLSSKDLDELKSKAKKSNNALLMRRVNLAKTFKKMKK